MKNDVVSILEIEKMGRAARRDSRVVALVKVYNQPVIKDKDLKIWFIEQVLQAYKGV